MDVYRAIGSFVLGAVLCPFVGVNALAQAGVTASPGQCTCREGTDSNHGQFVSTIDNAHLCVSTPVENNRPMCRITVHCLSDGTGHGCPAHSNAVGAAEAAGSGATDLSEELNAFAEALETALVVGSDVYNQPSLADHQQLGDVLRDQGNAEALRLCFVAFSDPQADAALEDGETLRCHYRPETSNLSIEVPVTWESDGSAGTVTVQIVRPE